MNWEKKEYRIEDIYIMLKTDEKGKYIVPVLSKDEILESLDFIDIDDEKGVSRSLPQRTFKSDSLPN